MTLGGGEIYYHLTYIDDLIEGLRLCGEHPAAANRTYILAGGEVTTLNELVKRVAEGAGRGSELRGPAVGTDRGRLEQHTAASHVDDRERVRVAVRVNADHVVQLICKHPH